MESEFTNQSTRGIPFPSCPNSVANIVVTLAFSHPTCVGYTWRHAIDDVFKLTSKAQLPKNMGDFFGKFSVNLGRGSPWYNLRESNACNSWDFIKSDLSSKPQYEKQEVPFHDTCWVNDRIPNKEKFHYSNQPKVRLLDSPKFITQDEGGNRIPVSIWIPLATVPCSQGIPEIAANLREPTDLFNLWLDLLAAFISSKHLKYTRIGSVCTVSQLPQTLQHRIPLTSESSKIQLTIGSESSQKQVYLKGTTWSGLSLK